MPYLLDSDVLIDVSRGKSEAREFLDALPEGWAISQVSCLELIVGARDNRELADIDTFLSAYVIVPLRDSTGTRAYDFSSGMRNLTACTFSIRLWRLRRLTKASHW
jgi:predicted nucleic acid-binding protein